MLDTNDTSGTGARPAWFHDLLIRGLPPVCGGDGSDESGAGEETPAQPPANSNDATSNDEPLGEAGKLALQREREAREAADKALKAANAKLAAIEKAQKQAADEKAAKDGEWEKLAGDRQQRIDELETELAKRDRADLVRKVATAHKLPDELAEVLQGDDEAALTEHAKRLAKVVKPAAPPETEAGAGNRNGAQRPVSGQKPQGQQNQQQETAKPLVTTEGVQKVAWPG